MNTKIHFLTSAKKEITAPIVIMSADPNTRCRTYIENGAFDVLNGESDFPASLKLLKK